MPRLHKVEARAEAGMPASASWRLRDTGEIRCTSQDPGVLRNVHQMRTPRETPARRNVLGLRRDFVGRRGAGKGVPPGDGQTVPRPVGPWRPQCIKRTQKQEMTHIMCFCSWRFNLISRPSVFGSRLSVTSASSLLHFRVLVPLSII